MLRKLRKRIKGQSTAEYAILIALVVAAVIAMQTYAKRAIQAKIKDATDYMGTEVSNAGGASFGATDQYEPYYSESQFAVTRDQDQAYKEEGMDRIGQDSTMNITRDKGGYQVTKNADFAP